MLNLIRSDLYKVFHMKSFWICGIIPALSAFMVILTAEENAVMYIEEIVGFSGSPFLTLLTSIFIAFFIGSEYKRGYIKNIAGNLPDRAMLFVSKMVIILIVNLIYFAVLFIFSLAVDSIFFEVIFDGSTVNTCIIQGLLLLFLNYAVCLVVAMISVGSQGNSGACVTMAVLISAGIMSQVAQMFVSIFQNMELISWDFNISEYFSTTYINYFCTEYMEENVGTALIVGSIYIVLSTVLTILHIKKKDI